MTDHECTSSTYCEICEAIIQTLDFKKGDRVRITMDHTARAVSGSFGAGWGEGIVLTAVNNQWDPDKPPNWYIELEKDKVSGRGWRIGYGYWKQQQDGGTIEHVS